MIKIVRLKRKTLSINIDVFGKITVKAPLFVSDKEINEFIDAKKPWINKVIKNINSTNSEYCEIFNKNKGLFFGKIVDFNEDFIKLVKNTADIYLPKRIQYISEKTNLPFKSIKIKNYKSRWGSCDRFNNITLNYKLVMIDKTLIDYVIVHELCHTVYFNHKREFHNLLKKYFKNDFEIRKRLNRYSFINKIEY